MKLGRMRHLFAITIGCIDYLLCFTFLRDSNQKSFYHVAYQLGSPSKTLVLRMGQFMYNLVHIRIA